MNEWMTLILLDKRTEKKNNARQDVEKKRPSATRIGTKQNFSSEKGESVLLNSICIHVTNRLYGKGGGEERGFYKIRFWRILFEQSFDYDDDDVFMI